jgi:hypothetical protein
MFSKVELERRIRAIHRPFNIYDECDHHHNAGDPSVVDAEHIGLTCKKLYSICRNCCCNADGQTIDCAESHNHDTTLPICETIAALSEAVS